MRAFAILTFLFAATCCAVTAQAAGLTVTDAKIVAGKLKVTGTTPQPNQLVTLDDSFTVRSNASNAFTFNIVYLPADCIVDLKAGAGKDSAVIAGCAVGPGRGADANGTISLSGIPNGRCNQVTFNVGGAKAGDVAVVETKAAIQNGIFLYANRTASDGHVEVNACNLSGGAMTAISSFPVRVMTFR